MLSLIELQNKKVEAKRKKYEKDEMDAYLELVFENYKKLLEENKKLEAEKAAQNKKIEAEKAEQNKKIKTLSDGIQYYRSIETTLQKALILAEKTSKETKDAAILKAESIEKEANKRADDIIQTAEDEYNKIKNKCIRLIQQFNQYKLQLREAASAQLQLVDGEQFDISDPDELEKSLDTQKYEVPAKKPVPEKKPEPKKKPEPARPDSARQKAPEEQSVDSFDMTPEEILIADTIDLGNTLNAVKEEAETEPKPMPKQESKPMAKPEPKPEPKSEPKPGAVVSPAAVTPAGVPVSPTVVATTAQPKEPEPVKPPVEKPATKPVTVSQPVEQPVAAKSAGTGNAVAETAATKSAGTGNAMAETAAADSVIEKPVKPKQEKPKESIDQLDELKPSSSVQDTPVLEPVAPAPVEPMDIIFEDEIAANEELNNETIELKPEDKSDSVPTLDSLLQDLNINNRNNQKSDDPFEFLGSVDDF